MGAMFQWVENVEGFCNVCGKAYFGTDRVGIFKTGREVGQDVWVCPLCLIKATQKIMLYRKGELDG